MKDIPKELLYVLMFLAIVLLQYLMKRFGPQAPEEPAWDERLEQMPEEVAAAVTPATGFGLSGVAAGLSGRGDGPRVAPASARRRFSRDALLGSRREMQAAVVVATILGPCRASELHDGRQ